MSAPESPGFGHPTQIPPSAFAKEAFCGYVGVLCPRHVADGHICLHPAYPSPAACHPTSVQTLIKYKY